MIMASIQRVVIDQQMAELGMRVTPSKMQISTPQPRMSITNEAPQMEIERKAPSFKVNWKKVQAESGLKQPKEIMKDFSSSGKAGAYRGAKTAVEDGNFLGDVTSPGDRVGRLARKKKMSAVQKQTQINVQSMPKSRPEFEWDRGYMRVSWSKHRITIDFDGEYMPQTSVDPPYSIEVFLRQKPYFRVMVEDAAPLFAPGTQVDAEA